MFRFSSMVDDIDQKAVIIRVDGCRDEKATHPVVANIALGYHGRANGTISGYSVGFDMNDGFDFFHDFWYWSLAG